MRTLTSAVVALIASVGALVGYELNTANRPHCPTEDSCAVDYRDGRWTITEVTP